MKHCPICDIEGPHQPGPFFTSHEMIDAHRAFHQLGRELMKPFERLINWIETKLTRS